MNPYWVIVLFLPLTERAAEVQRRLRAAHAAAFGLVAETLRIAIADFLDLDEAGNDERAQDVR